MALCFFCYDDQGRVVHIHEQDEPSPDQREEVKNGCIRSGMAHSQEEIQLEDLPRRLNEIRDRGQIEPTTVDRVYSRFSERELKDRAVVEENRRRAEQEAAERALEEMVVPREPQGGGALMK